MADDGDYDDGGGDGGINEDLDEEEFIEDDQDLDEGQGTQTGQE